MGIYLHKRIGEVKMYLRKVFLMFALISIVFFVQATIALTDDESTWDFQYRGIRAMGMGNSFGAVSDDADAFYYNPSGLSSIRGFRLDIQPVRIIPTQDFYNETKDIDELIDDIDRLSSSDDPLGDPNLKDERIRLMNKIERLVVEQVGADLAVPVRIMFPLHIGDYGVTIGGIAHEWVGAQIDVRKKGLQWGNFVTDILDDEIFYKVIEERLYGVSSAISFPMPSLPVKLSVGLTAKMIERAILTDEDNLLDFADLMNPEGKDNIKGTADDFENLYFDPDNPLSSRITGTGFGIDGGMMASIGDDTMKVGLYSRNLLGSIKYDDNEDETFNRLFNVSASVNLAKLPNPNIPMIDLILSGDYVGIGSDNPKPRAGLELILRPLNLISVSARVGNNNGFLTLGAGIQLMFLDIDYAFYGDEITNWHAVSLNLSF